MKCSHTIQVLPLSVLTMYKSLIEPHLTYDCEAALDVRPSSLKPLTTVQPTLLRRALEIGPSVTTHNSLPGDKNMAARRSSCDDCGGLRHVLRDEPTLALAAVREAW